jgi:hypothetical protein
MISKVILETGPLEKLAERHLARFVDAREWREIR